MRLPSKAGLLKAFDASFGWSACKLLGRIRHAAGLPGLSPTPQSSDLRRILVIRPGGMGDMLMLLPAIKAAAALHPRLEIDIVCEKRNRDVLKLAGLEKHALLYDARPLALLRRLRTMRYDAAIDTEQFHNSSAVLALLSGAPVRVGFRINPARLHLYTHLVDYEVDGYEADQFLRLFTAAGIRISAPPRHGSLAGISLPDDPGPVLRPPSGRPLIALGPGAADSYKQWGAGNFAKLARRLLEGGYAPVLVGGRTDRRSSRLIVSLLGNPDTISDATGVVSLARTAAILKRCELFIGCDSGLAHLAAALGTRTVVIFGPSDARKWAAPDERHAVIRRGLPCTPCAIFGYRKWCRAVPCMRTVGVEEVHSAAKALLA